MKHQLYWHFRMNKPFYQFILVALAALIPLFTISQAFKERRRSQYELVKAWPLVEAEILESKITFIDRSSQTSFGGSEHVSLRVKYRMSESGPMLETKVIGQWYYQHEIGGKAQFEVGKSIMLRVHPENPKRASLIDITGSI